MLAAVCRIRKAGTRRNLAGRYDGVSGAFCNVNGTQTSLSDYFGEPFASLTAYRGFCAFPKIRAQFTQSLLAVASGGLLRPRVRDPQQHVGVARLVERAPAGEIFVVQAVANRAR
jgi:hypothetical protein